MASLGLLGLGLLLLIVQAVLATLVPLYAMAPNPLLPIVIYLGISSEVSIARGALLSFALGYMLDAFVGMPIGPYTFVLVAAFLGARSAGLRLFPRGAGFQAVLTFLISLVAGGTVLALLSMFDPRRSEPFATGGLRANLLVCAGSAVLTASLAPMLFSLVRRIEAWSRDAAEERAT